MCQGEQRIAARSLIGALQPRILEHDGTVRSAAYIGGSREIDVAEMTDTITPNVPIAISASLKVDDVKVLARSTETVPDTADGMDQRISLLVIHFPTHAANIDVDNIS